MLRQAWRTPGFVLTAAATLALGIGANTGIFSIINGFQRPLPVPNADQIVVIAAVMPGDDTGLRYRFSFPGIEDYRRLSTAFSDVFAFDVRISGLAVDGKTTQFVYQIVTGNFFTGLGLNAAAGKLFVPGEGEHASADAVIVLGHGYWLRRFGGDPDVVGRTVKFDGQAARIVGISPAGFRGLMEGAEMDGYVTLGTSKRPDGLPDQFFIDREMRRMTMVARLKPGVSLAEAQVSVDRVAAQIAAENPATEKDTGARVIPERLARPMPLGILTSLLPAIRALLVVLSMVVLLIACMNVANILLVRVTVREREMAVRASLGASRLRLIRLLLLESLMLAVLGTAGGLLIGDWVGQLLLNSIDLGMDIPFVMDASFDWRVFTYAGFCAIGTGLVVGALPARRASRAQIASLLHEGGRSGSATAGRRRVRSALVVAQIAGSLVLLIVAGLFVRNLQEAQRVNLGFDPNGVVIARLDTTHIGYDKVRSDAFYKELDQRIHAIPGVVSASMSFTVPLSWIFGGYLAHPEGQSEEGAGPLPPIGVNTVSPEYFATMKIPIVTGRGFTAYDDERATRVAVVNETLAERFWPNQNPIGKRISIPLIPGPPWEVVGVTATSKYLTVFEGPLPYFYLAQAQNSSFLRTIEVRSGIPEDEMRIRLARVITELEPELPIADLNPFARTLRGNMGFMLFRIGALQASLMGVLGLALAVIGVYGVVSYQTAQREKEIGIRVALGAEPGDVRRLVLNQGSRLVLTGVAIGLALTILVTMALRRVIVLVSTTDPLTFIGVTAVLGVSALAACYLPARRATKVEPVAVLRQE